MKKHNILKKAAAFALVLCTSFTFAACGTEKGGNSGNNGGGTDIIDPIPGGDDIDVMIGISMTTTNVVAGRAYKINVVSNSTDDYDFEFAVGSQYASFSRDYININTTAPKNAVISFFAKIGDTKSSTITLTVTKAYGSDEGELEITAAMENAETSVYAGSSYNVVVESNKNVSHSFVFTKGSDIASFNGDVLSINQNASTGSEIAFYACSGEVVSNTITLTVGQMQIVDDLTISATIENNSSLVYISKSYELDVTLNKAAAYAWNFVSGGDYASISGDVLTINSDAPENTIIKFKAVSGNAESNVISVTTAHKEPFIVSIKSELVPSIAILGQQINVVVDALTIKNEQSTRTPSLRIISGSQYVSVDGLTITINDTIADLDTLESVEVSFEAVCGSVESDFCTFKIENATFRSVAFPVNTAKIDTYYNNYQSYSAELETADGKYIQSTLIDYSIVEGAGCCTLVASEGTAGFTLNNLKNGVVKIKAEYESYSDYMTITIQKAPKFILSSDARLDNDVVYKFSNTQPIPYYTYKTDTAESGYSADYQMFIYSASTLVAQFTYFNGTYEQDLNTIGATLDDSGLKIQTCGTYKANFKSYSGSKGDIASGSFNFTINTGKNVSSYADLCEIFYTVDKLDAFMAQRTIAPTVEQEQGIILNFVDDIKITQRQNFFHLGGAVLNGNGFTVDTSEVEIEDYKNYDFYTAMSAGAKAYYNSVKNSLFVFDGAYQNDAASKHVNYALYDLKFNGNFTNGTYEELSALMGGIDVSLLSNEDIFRYANKFQVCFYSHDNKAYTATIDIDGITVVNALGGIEIRNAVNRIEGQPQATIKNIKMEEIFAEGFLTHNVDTKIDYAIFNQVTVPLSDNMDDQLFAITGKTSDDLYLTGFVTLGENIETNFMSTGDSVFLTNVLCKDKTAKEIVVGLGGLSGIIQKYLALKVTELMDEVENMQNGTAKEKTKANINEFSKSLFTVKDSKNYFELVYFAGDERSTDVSVYKINDCISRVDDETIKKGLPTTEYVALDIKEALAEILLDFNNGAYAGYLDELIFRIVVKNQMFEG